VLLLTFRGNDSKIDDMTASIDWRFFANISFNVCLMTTIPDML